MKKAPRVALVTCVPFMDPDPDHALLLGALRERGLNAEYLAWDDPAARFDAVDLAVVRSTWNYHRHAEAFLAWVEATARRTRLLNPAQVIRANWHKSYLLEVAARGLATVPTELIRREDPRTLDEVLKARAWPRAVLKPAVSAGSHETHRIRAPLGPEAIELFGRLHAQEDLLLQPYVESVEDYGERSLIWIDGEFTHAIRKSPRFFGDQEQVSSARAFSSAEHALASLVLAPLAEQLLYARVDLAKDAAGQPMLMELELIEPSLFLAENPIALRRLVEAIAARAGAA